MNYRETGLVRKRKKEIDYRYPEALEGRFPGNVLSDNNDEIKKHFPVSKMNDINASQFFFSRRVLTGGTRGFEKNYDERSMDGFVENTHPTIKPINVMAHIINLLTPDLGIVLDPFQLISSIEPN